MANILHVERAANKITLGTTGTTICITPKLRIGDTSAAEETLDIRGTDATGQLRIHYDDSNSFGLRCTSSGDGEFRTIGSNLSWDGEYSGVQKAFRFWNESPDAGSGMQFQCYTQGDNAGDPVFRFKINPSGGQWLMGIDNSDSDKFKISASNVPETNTAITIDSFFNITFGGNLIVPKASGNGIKVDTATPTFGFADLLGDQFSRNTGASKPTLATYNGAVKAWQFSDGDEAYLTYHIPHDYVPGTDLHLHVHWSQNNAGATGGTIDFKYFAIYAKGHNQVSGSVFTSTPITATFSSIDINDGDSGLNQYQQHITEITISAASANAALFDRDDFEPDGVIELTFEMDANNLTGTPSDPFIHYVDIHYQTTGLIGTKQKAPDFYT